MYRSRPLGHRRLGSTVVAALFTLTASLALASPASAQLSFQGFVTHGDAKAGWITETNTPVGATDQDSIELFVNGTGPTDLDDAARAILTGIGETPPATPPSFDFKVSSTGDSGGSVRLLIRFSDGGSGELRPLTLQSGQWTHEDGATSDWDTRGGSCAGLTQQSYAELLACHPGATVAGVELVNDSGWLHPGGFQVLVDNVSYGGETITAPPPPVQGESLTLTNVAGDVTVRLPEKIGFGDAASDLAKLSGTTTLPVGGVVDARLGQARLTSEGGASQSAVFREGRFRVKQSRKRNGVTQLSLRGKLDCSRRGARASSGPSAHAAVTSRRLWGRGRGRFRTRGSYSSGSVRGTHWLTEDRCNGTLTRVLVGIVEVRDFVRHETILVGKGESYFARPALR